MSGFDKDWLKLREPADRTARSKPMLETVQQHLSSLPQPHIIMDIGCGTGSTYRTLSPILAHAEWKLLDYEPDLLEEAQRQIGPRENVSFYCQDMNLFDETLLDGVGIVTASALFDLCSADFCDRLIGRLATRRIGLYAALNYGGVMEWSIKHPLDARVVEDFNLHQRSDKGFGPALGPQASTHLSAISSALGFVTQTAQSPWRLGPEAAELQMQFLDGLQTPVQEIGTIGNMEFADWLDFRRSNIGTKGSVCIVGHTDFLALPVI